MEKKSKKNNVSASNNEVDRIEAVRNLIFGENIKQYDSEFADVYDKIKELQQQTNSDLAATVSNIESKLSNLQSLIDNKFQVLNSELDKGLSDLESEKVGTRKLGKALEKIALMLQE